MKICLTSQGENLDAQMDPRFGRCKFFVIVDSETMNFEAIKNTYREASGGAGIQAGQFVAAKQVDIVLTGNVGPNAYRTLSTAGIKVFTGASGTLKQAIEAHKADQFKQSEAPSVDSKFGGNVGS